MRPRLPLGTRVRDRLSGFEGHAVARIEHLHGVPEFKVIALRDGAIYAEWIDEARCDPSDADVPCGFEAEPSPPRVCSPECKGESHDAIKGGTP